MSELFATSAPVSSDRTLNSCFGAFCSVWVHFGSFHYYLKLGAKWIELWLLLQKFVPQSRVRIFTMNALDPPHWTLNSCFSAFCSVWVHLGSFFYCMKFGAKWAEQVQLIQKFVPRIRVVIFHIERTQSNPLDHKPPFWCVLQCLDAFGIISLRPETWCKMS